MKLSEYKKHIRIGVTAFLTAAACLLFYYLLFHFSSIRLIAGQIFDVIRPLVYGLIIAYVLSPLINLMEGKVVALLYKKAGKIQTKKHRHLTRGILIALTYMVVIAAIYGLFASLIPEIISSISNIVQNFSTYVDSTQKLLEELFHNYPELQQTTTGYLSDFSVKFSAWLTNDLIPSLRLILLDLSGQVMNMFTLLKNIILGAIVAIYLIYHKEKYIGILKKGVYALFSMEHANGLIQDFQYINREFSGFLIGKVIDSLIIGIICYVVTGIIGTPYAMLVSVIIGVTNIIPFFGPFLGAVPCIFLILLINPLQSLYFLIFVVLLQQFDGNFLGPKILGETTGVSSFLIIVSILIGGGFWGVFGMVVAVPLCAIFCTIVRNIIERRLAGKGLPLDSGFYIHIDHLDENTKQPVLGKKKEFDKQELFQYRQRSAKKASVRDVLPSASDDAKPEEKDPDNDSISD